MFDQRTCNNIKGNAKVAEVLQCRVSFLNFGPHLEKFIPNYSMLPICQKQSIKESLDLYMNEKEKCLGVKACESISYSAFIRKKDYLRYDYNYTVLNVAYSSFQVEHYTTYVSYDIMNLTAELGGLMGMTLGLAFSSIGDLVANLARKYL